MLTVFKEMKLRSHTKGDIGVEIEVEGKNLPRLAKWWKNEHDGSLRGEENMEYVLAKPGTLDEVKQALDYLDKAYIAKGSVVDDTVRAGVHIHVNCQELTMVQLYNFFCVYIIVEEILVKFCGEHREGNLFCLRIKDADYTLSEIRRAMKTKKFREVFHTDALRYSAMNVKALGDYGSLEFRTMRGTRDLSLIYKWAEILFNLREYAKTFTYPYEVIERFSMIGYEQFFNEVFKDNAELLLCNGYGDMMFDGARYAQDIAYNKEWQLWNEKGRMIGKIEFDPTADDTNEPPEDY